MTATQIAKSLGLPLKEVIEFIRANATFPVKRNFQTGEISIPDDVDIEAFFAPLLSKKHDEKLAEERQSAVDHAQQEQQAIESSVQQILRQRQDVERQNFVAIAALKKTGAEGYYEYKVISLLDMGLFSGKSGRVNTAAMTQTLNELGIEGWRLVTAYSNEMSKHITHGDITAFQSPSIDENILIFERFVKFE